MKRTTFTMVVAIAMFATSAIAAGRVVKSKLGDLDLTVQRGGGGVVCTAGFHDELTIVRESDVDVLVKGACGQGGVEKSKVEYVAAKPGDKSIKIDNFDVHAWIDNPTAFELFADNYADFDDVTINRDFKEYLQHTMDREQMEMSRGEN